MKKTILLLTFSILTFCIHAKQMQLNAVDSAHNHFSFETDPAFWFGVLPQGAAFDLNVDFRPASLPHLRFGLLGYSGKWAGELGRNLLLTADFTEDYWRISWNGAGAEMQYRFAKNDKRSSLLAGGRAQWNQFIYRNADEVEQARANHFTLTPQMGYQWFPFKKAGLYILPWAGIQLPVAGSDDVSVNNNLRSTRKPIAVVTAHIGWEFEL